jgi:hypothetical protein
MLKAIRIRRIPIAWACLPALALYLVGCVGYNERHVPFDEPLIVGPDKVLVLHAGAKAWELDAPVVDGKGISGRTRSIAQSTSDAGLPAARQARAARVAADSRNPGMPGKGQRVDVYLSDGSPLPADTGAFALPWKGIDRISVYDVSLGKTLLMWTAGAAGAMAIVVVIILLTKDSCPFVYADNGSGYGFTGEIFSGAVYPQMERRDWLPLPAPTSRDYKIRITNEVKEIQHIDAATLLMARHPQGTQVLLDKEGRPHTVAAPLAPIACTTAGGKDALALVKARDSSAYLGGDGSAKEGWQDGLTLAFPRPMDARQGKLILRAKNSFWLDYLYGQFLDLFGGKLEGWNGKMSQAPREKLEQWFRDQNLPLIVEVKGTEGWKEAAALSLPGPMAARDFLVPLNLPAAATDTLAVRLRCGFLFWEIDYAAMDYSADQAVDLLPVQALKAADQDGRDLRGPLAAEDGVRYDQPRVGDAAELVFAVPEAPAGRAQSAFLFSRGYYDILRKPEGRPRMAALKRFREPGALSRFSAERMAEQAAGISHAL